MKKLVGLLFLIAISIGCYNNYTEIKKNTDLRNAFILNSSPTFKGYYYTGSDSAFHYFAAKWEFQKDKYFKIAVKNLNVVNDLRFKKSSNELRIDLLKEDNKVFAENEFYTLYVIKNK